MKYHIDTIPIWDAFKQEDECPLCRIERALEEKYVDASLGGSVMEPDTRIRVNSLGFCRDHLGMLYDKQNRLGLALMCHTHLKDVEARLDAQAAALMAAADSDAGKNIAVRAARAATRSSECAAETKKLAELTHRAVSTCIICSQMEATMARYAQTVCAMWENEEDFRAALSGSKGFCLPHYALLLDAVAGEMTGKQQRELARALAAVEKANLARIERDIEWYTLKFDYRNHDKPWNDSRDAVERTLGKLRSWRPAGKPAAPEK